MRQLHEHELDDIALGAAILGTGGGGDPYIGKLLARSVLRESGPATLVDVDELSDEALVVPVAMMGAPTIMIEKLSSETELHGSFEAAEQHLGRRITHVACGEAGGINSLFPIAVAARRNLPLVDADLMGRAFPELQMTIPTIYGIPAAPVSMADEKGNALIVAARDNHWTERFARTAAIEMGCAAAITLYPMTGRQFREASVPRTITLCGELGRAVREARQQHEDPVDAVADRLGGARLFDGKVIDVARATTGGFAKLEARIEGTGDDRGATLVIRSQNEHLLAMRDGRVIASAPDLIMILESESGESVTTELLRYGFRVAIVAAPCDERWRTPEGIALVGPRYFGYDVDYAPICTAASA